MDKRKVIEAYYRGLLTIEECAQILGSNRNQVSELVESRSELINMSSVQPLQTEQA
jgi:exonuclease VII small subunit